ncbi:zeta toxin family protein [Hahella ganghwensis]|uniref:zeta toxin family protein n=1 Tax=Hahella ganghwensis TaxID=286420 RepID=UPI000381060E|nr:zeta toxin family protein [Hahella ganghwensis]
MTKKPKLILIAGPNGSGKSTLTNHLMTKGFDFGVYVNPDEIAARLTGSDIERARQAQKIAENQRNKLRVAGVSHSFESVMSHPSKIEYMVQAQADGFEVTLLFVGINDPKVNVRRVANRVKEGGHPVPIDKILSRYQRTMDMLFDAAMTADHALIFDNSSDEGIKLIAEVKNSDLIRYEKGVPWVQVHFMDKYTKKNET